MTATWLEGNSDKKDGLHRSPYFFFELSRDKAKLLPPFSPVFTLPGDELDTFRTSLNHLDVSDVAACTIVGAVDADEPEHSSYFGAGQFFLPLEVDDFFPTGPIVAKLPDFFESGAGDVLRPKDTTSGFPFEMKMLSPSWHLDLFTLLRDADSQGDLEYTLQAFAIDEGEVAWNVSPLKGLVDEPIANGLNPVQIMSIVGRVETFVKNRTIGKGLAMTETGHVQCFRYH